MSNTDDDLRVDTGWVINKNVNLKCIEGLFYIIWA
jgi:hypothetical protein